MKRRSFVASGTLTAITGCVGSRRGSDDPPATGERTPTATGTATPEPTTDVTVDALHLQYGVVTPSSPDSIGVSNAGTPYLVATVRVDGPLSREAFGLRMGDVRYGPTRLDRLYRTSWGDDHWYERGRTEGLVLFEAPAEATDGLRVTWPGGEHPVDERIVARLDGSEPRVTASLDVPTEHDGKTAPAVTVEVTNEGSTPGRFLGALNRVGPRVAYAPITRLSELVAGGERTTIAVADSWSGRPADERVGDGDPDVTYHLDYGGGEDSADIRLV